ncbi:MAG: hypothetical protein HC933_17385 [Pleurocapsa sp. SU_196_0]|nr:hypothetical protein [Pleurocapsa sp. SU_196_0]
MGNKIQTLAAIAGIFGLLVAVLALMRDTFDYKVPWIPVPWIPVQSNTPTPNSQDSGISKTGVAIVFDPPSNVRKSPNEEILCSIREKKTINVYGSTGSWYWTDICGTMEVIDSSQVTFQPK